MKKDDIDLTHVETSAKEFKRKFKVPVWRDSASTPQERGKACFNDFDRISDKYTNLDTLRLKGFALYNNVASKTTAGAKDILINKLVNTYYTTHVSTVNLVKVCVNTLGSSITSSKTRISFQTYGADSLDKSKALQCQAYMDGVFDDQQVHKHGRKAFWDAMVFGTGALKTYIDKVNQKVRIEYVPSPQLYIPELNTTVDDPEEIFQVYHLTLSKLLELYPDKEEEMYDAVGKDNEPTEEDIYRVVERWRVAPSADTAGFHSVSWEFGELYSEDWNMRELPFAYCWYNRPTVGFYGTGAVADLREIQIEMNKLFLRNQQSIRENAVTKWIVQPGSGVTFDDLNSEYNTIIESEKPPIPLTPNVILPPAVMATWNMLWQKGYEVMGINQLNSAGILPPGLANGSGRAQEEYQETVSKRFSMIEEDFRQMHIQIARKVLMLTHELDETSQKLLVKLVGKNASVAKIPWSKIKLEDDLYSIRAYNSSYLPLTPAARFNVLDSFMKLGMPKEDAFNMMEMPDTTEYQSLQAAELQAVQAQIDRIIRDKQVSETISPMFDQQLAVNYAKARYAQIVKQYDGGDQDVLYLLEKFIDTAKLPLPQSTDGSSLPSGAPPAVPTPGTPAPAADIAAAQFSNQQSLI